MYPSTARAPTAARDADDITEPSFIITRRLPAKLVIYKAVPSPDRVTNIDNTVVAFVLWIADIVLLFKLLNPR
jgi:hypothetical protein